MSPAAPADEKPETRRIFQNLRGTAVLMAHERVFNSTDVGQVCFFPAGSGKNFRRHTGRIAKIKGPGATGIGDGGQYTATPKHMPGPAPEN
jgi:hypothetical protein